MSKSRLPGVEADSPAGSFGVEGPDLFSPEWSQPEWSRPELACYGNAAFAEDMLGQTSLMSAPSSGTASGAAAAAPSAPPQDTLMDRVARTMKATANRNDPADKRAKNRHDGAEQYMPYTLLGTSGDWCGAFGARHYIEAIAGPSGKRGLNPEAWKLARDLGQKLASDTKIKKGFKDPLDIVKATEDAPGLRAQYRAWDQGETGLEGGDPARAQLSGRAADDVSLFGAGDSMLIDFKGAAPPSGRYTTGKDGYTKDRSDHITWVTGTSVDEQSNNLAFIHTAEGNVRGRQDGKVTRKNTYTEVEHTYLLVPRKKGGEGADKDEVVGYDSIRFAANIDGRAMDIPDLIKLGKDDPQNKYGLKVDEKTTPEDIQAQLKEITKGLNENDYILDTPRIDGQLDFEEVPATSASGETGKASPEATTGPVTAPTVTTKRPETLRR